MGKKIQETNLFNFDFSFYKITKPIRLIELFGGVGSQAKALKNIGANFEHYKLVEFDKYCIKSYNAIHGTDFNTQDIKQVKGENLEIVDTDKFTYLLTYSFPCTDLSKAGKMEGMSEESGTRSSLLWEVKRLLQETKNLPQVLLMENVPEVHSSNNISDFSKFISFLEKLGYSNFYADLNAKNYGIPQIRDRCFMVSLLGNFRYEFPKPFKLELRVKDMLENETDEKFYLSDKMIEYIVANNEKWEGSKKSVVNKSVATCITTGEGTRRCDASNYIVKGLPEDTDLKEAVRIGGVFDKDGVKHQAGSVWDINGLSPTLDTMQGGYRQPCILIREATKKGYAVAEEGDGVYLNRLHQKHGVVQKGMIQTIKCNGNDLGVVVLGNYSPSKHNASRIVDSNGLAPTVMDNHGTVTATVVAAAQRGRGEGWKQEIEVSDREYANAITTVNKDSMVAIKVKDKVDNEIPLWTNYKKLVETVDQNEMPIGEVKHMDLYNRKLTNNCGTLSDPCHNNNRLWDGLRIRKLTPKECWRLMGFDDEDFDKASKVNSNSQLYKQAGNSIVVQVLEEIFKKLF